MTSSEPWSVAESLDDPPLPPFPTDTLPGPMRDVVEAGAEATQTPTDLAAMLALGMVSACCSGRVQVAVAPPGGDVLFVEPTNLYVLVSLGPGNMKSAVERALKAPLDAWVNGERRRLEPVTRAKQTERELLTKQRDQAMTAAAKSDQGPDGLRTVLDLDDALDRVEVPMLPRLFADDTTPEALVRVLAEQGERAALVSAEGGLVATLAGRYSRDVPNLDLVLKCYSGDAVTVDRVGRDTQNLAHPHLTVALAVQPDVLRSLVTHSEFRGRGLVARFAYACPASFVGARNVTDPTPVPPDVLERWALFLRGLADRYSEPDKVRTLTLDTDAHRRYVAFREMLEPRLGPGGDLADMADWGNHLHGRLLRITGLLAACGDGPDVISGPTMARAARMCDYFAAHAQRALGAGSEGPLDDARHLLAWIRRNGAPTFTWSDAQRANRGRFATPDSIEPAFITLSETGWVRYLEREPGKAGRPSPTFAVNPAALGVEP